MAPPLSLKLDLLFIMDVTASQGPYIKNVIDSIETICGDILKSDMVQSEDLRFGIVAFRDHPPQDYSFVTRNFAFTSDVKIMLRNLKTLRSVGGGDPPEAITAALDKALIMDWRTDPLCTKIAVLISDAPPHGIGSFGDGFPDGVPGDSDPLKVAREMMKRGIIMHFIACEPTLSSHTNAVEFYRGLTRITSGVVIPLTSPETLSRCIIGSALESLELEELTRELERELSELVEQQQQPEVVISYLYQLLRLRNREITQLNVDGIYNWSSERTDNVATWTSAKDIADAKAHLKKADGSPFVTKADRHFYPERYVSITFKNISDRHIKITWRDKDGKPMSRDDGQMALDRSFPPYSMETIFPEVHELQRFLLRHGRFTYTLEEHFTKNMDINLADYLQFLHHSSLS